eukprot:TRINITY_DN10274_c0_g1_i1.p1 TRINITY_DN10274_c0_g1~~TRINITY_DN10274_c0_g1_i1.p1  ORF type:complete len:528 (-),score=99.65 TRINITY_DN10274_c0_g1_i1:58-1641(-)
MNWRFILFFVTFLWEICLTRGEWHSLVLNAGQYKLISGKVKNGVAWGKFENKMNEMGWTILTLESNPNFDDQTQAYAAGYLEGKLTMTQIHENYVNMAPLDPPLDPRVAQFPIQNLNWMNTQIPNPSNPTPSFSQKYWTQVGLVLNQSQGMFDGFNSLAPNEWKLTWYQWNALQLGCDWGDINSTVSNAPTSDDNLHCSALVRLTPGNKELLSSHVTWSSYSWLLRVWKNYKLNFNSTRTGTKARRISYSGYPGVIPSFDDFYITDQQLTIFETTNSVWNMDLFKYVTINTVPYWIRVTVAARMADSGKEWNDIFGYHNSGTYNNQWMVIDYKRFVPSSPTIKSGLLWVTEQIPGQLYGGDQSKFLEQNGFWSSYNIPYYPYIYNISGYPAQSQRNNASSYEWCPRAQIFRRDAPKVNNLNDFKKIMRYNNYQQDPFALNNSCNGISARCDLNVPFCSSGLNPRLHGGLDSKISTQDTMKKMSAHIISGPTWDQQLPFAWNQRYTNVSHLGHAKVYAFDFNEVVPQY